MPELARKLLADGRRQPVGKGRAEGVRPPEPGSFVFVNVATALNDAFGKMFVTELIKEVTSQSPDAMTLSTNSARTGVPVGVAPRYTFGLPTIGANGELLYHPYKIAYHNQETLTCRAAQPKTRVVLELANELTSDCGAVNEMIIGACLAQLILIILFTLCARCPVDPLDPCISLSTAASWRGRPSGPPACSPSGR